MVGTGMLETDTDRPKRIGADMMAATGGAQIKSADMKGATLNRPAFAAKKIPFF